jgi:hypothetical protein
LLPGAVRPGVEQVVDDHRVLVAVFEEAGEQLVVALVSYSYGEVSCSAV